MKNIYISLFVICYWDANLRQKKEKNEQEKAELNNSILKVILIDIIFLKFQFGMSQEDVHLIFKNY